MTPVERERLIQLMGMTGSHFDGEAVNALRLAGQLLQKHKLSWREVLADGNGTGREDEIANLHHQVAALSARTVALASENIALRRRLQERAQDGGGTGQAFIDHARQAQWILGLHEAGEIRLGQREYEFCQTVSRWSGDLTERQAPWFAAILARVRRATGKEPPE
jgi:hypothetical protein